MDYERYRELRIAEMCDVLSDYLYFLGGTDRDNLEYQEVNVDRLRDDLDTISKYFRNK